MLGASAVKDTYELLRDGIRKVLLLMDGKVKPKINLSLKAYGNDSKPKINREDKKEHQELLSLLVSDKEVLSHVDVNKEDVDTELKEAVNLLGKIVSQDIEEDKKGWLLR